MSATMYQQRVLIPILLLFGWLLASTLLFVGCDRRETIMEAETPTTEVDVERNLDTGALEIDVDRRDPVVP